MEESEAGKEKRHPVEGWRSQEIGSLRLLRVAPKGTQRSTKADVRVIPQTLVRNREPNLITVADQFRCVHPLDLRRQSSHLL